MGIGTLRRHHEETPPGLAGQGPQSSGTGPAVGVNARDGDARDVAPKAPPDDGPAKANKGRGGK